MIKPSVVLWSLVALWHTNGSRDGRILLITEAESVCKKFFKYSMTLHREDDQKVQGFPQPHRD